MPLPPALLGPAFGAAAKLFVTEYLPTISSASLAAVLGRLAWNRVPDWIKEDITLTRSNSSCSSHSQDDKGCSCRKRSQQDMERLSLVMEKLQAFVLSAAQRLNSPVPHVYASLLSYVQLCAQLKRIAPIARDDIYHSAGEPLPDCFNEMKEIRRILDYAIWAYYIEDEQEEFLMQELESAGFALMHRSVATRPGHVGHYMAASSKQKLLLIGLKGTSSLEDILTDMTGQAVSYHRSSSLDPTAEEEALLCYHSRIEVQGACPDEIATVMANLDHLHDENIGTEIISGHERIWIEDWDESDEDGHVRCHEGIFIAAQRVAKQVQTTVKSMVLEGGYKLLLTGHSLGASAACLLALILRSRMGLVSQPPRGGQDGSLIKVVCFAPPPVLDHDSAMAAQHYMTSVVNGSDLVTRSSLANVAVFLEFLRALSNRLADRGLRPVGPVTTASFLKMLSKGDRGDPLFTPQEIEEVMAAAQQKVELRHPDHLYIPGRVLLLHEDWNKNGASTKEESVNEDNEGSTQNNKAASFCTITDGSARVFRFVDIDGLSMLSDHTAAAYASTIESLMATLRGE